MAEEKKAAKVDSNPMATVQNWEQRVKSESEAPHKWNEAWGQYFNSGVPCEYVDRVRYLEGELNKFPQTAVRTAKYGIGQPFKDMGNDHRRKKMFQDPSEEC